MIQISGTVLIDRHEGDSDGGSRFVTCDVLAYLADDYLVARQTPGYEPQLASDIGHICGFTPPPTYIPAAPGWWARFKADDEEAGVHQIYLLPVVGWRLGSQESPVVLDNMNHIEEDSPHVVENPAVVDNPERECLGDLDAVIYDPSLSGIPASIKDE
jgi:hypothetical protein